MDQRGPIQCPMFTAPCSLPPAADWSTELAVGDNGFIEKMKKGVGRFVSKMTVQEAPGQYGQAQSQPNTLAWQIFEETDLQ